MLHVHLPRPALRPVRCLRTFAIAVTVLLLLLGAGVNTVIAKNIVCPFDVDCSGGKKADTIRGEGQNRLDGKGGSDTIISAGASWIYGGGGNDTIRAFARSNLGNDISSGKGDDVINTVNGVLDLIDCGPGKDTVRYDIGIDEMVNCEDQRPQ